MRLNYGYATEHGIIAIDGKTMKQCYDRNHSQKPLHIVSAWWANKPLNTFTEALEAFRTAISFRFVKWLNENWDVFSAYKASLGFVWA